MKTFKNLFLKRLLVRRESGQALVIVLAFVMLMTVMILVFFASVSTERASSKAAASGNSARQLAQSAVQIVEGTITQATVPSATDGTATAIAWASQPGMIRTYGGGTVGSAGSYSASSTPLAYYKLYSSLNPMIVTASTSPSIGNYNVDGDIIGNWDQYPALYTDLNAPRTASDGTTVYPIVDPRAASSTGVAVDGFSYSKTCAITTTTSVDGVVTGGGTGSLLPMPVAWIYVLEDGTLTTPSPTLSTATTASFSGSNNAPTATNPIVGRIAYWTDDECGKINLNTASEGTYWDPPLANSGSPTAVFNYPQNTAIGDTQLAGCQGAQYEYQRYPGHPATTCLSEVFGASLSSFGSTARASLVQTIDNSTPRLNDTTTPDAAVPASTGIASSMGGTTNATSVVPPKFDRLYSTVDDFNFTPTRSVQNLGSSATTTQQIIEQTRFFLTTASKGSDLNLFGLPRVTIWPVWDTTGAAGGANPANSPTNASKRSKLDNEMIRCSTVNNSPGAFSGSVDSGAGSEHLMEFTRDTALSPTIDFGLTRNQQLFKYLQTLTARGVPGFGGNFLTKYPAPSNSPPPANGASNYSSDRDQILTEIFDYIRCTDLADQGAWSSPAANTVCPTSYTPSLTAASSKPYRVPVGEVVPTEPSTSIPTSVSATSPAIASGASSTNCGFGRFPTISELALVLEKIDDRGTTASSGGLESTSNQVKTMTIVNGPASSITPATQTLVEWALIPQFFCPMAGYTGLGNNIRIQFTINGLTLGGSSFNENPTSGNYTTPVASTFTPDLFDGASSGTTLLTAGRLDNFRDSNIGGVIGPLTFTDGSNSPTGSMYPTGLFVATGSDLSATPGKISISAFTVTVKIYSPAGLSATSSGVNLIQTLNFSFPAMQVPIPQLALTASYTNPPAPATPVLIGYNWNGTFRGGSSNPTALVTGTSPNWTSSFTYGSDASSRSTGGRLDGYGVPISTSPNLGGGDVVRSVVPTGTLVGSTNIQGDMRLVSMSPVVSTSTLANLAQKIGSAPTSTDFSVCGIRSSSGSEAGPPKGFAQGTLFQIGATPYSSNPYGNTPPAVPAGITAVTMAGDAGTPPGDWDNAPSLMCDGPFINKPDEGMDFTTGGTLPYIGNYTTPSSAPIMSTTFFSPNRQVSSPVMMGSLSVGPDHPWRTLLFRPDNLPGYQGGYLHPGNTSTSLSSTATAVPDHLLLDLFRMPVVEPYAISDPLETSGQINLNTQIAPFTYITRTTGLRAVLKSVMITAVPSSTSFIKSGSLGYKYAYPQCGSLTGFNTRYAIDLNDTMAELNPSNPDSTYNFPEFNRTSHTAQYPNFFVSASQICDVPLIPLSATGAVTYNIGNLSTFWTANQLTGDNSLERPYSLIYPRVTTRSNTFTVHVRAQSLQKISNSVQTTWTEGTDQVAGEYRGSFTVEKYFDSTNSTITDVSGNILTDAQDANMPTTAAIRGVLWRLLDNKRFGQ